MAHLPRPLKLFALAFFVSGARVILYFCYCLLVPVQSIALKDSSPEQRVVSHMARKTLLNQLLCSRSGLYSWIYGVQSNNLQLLVCKMLYNKLMWKMESSFVQ